MVYLVENNYRGTTLMIEAPSKRKAQSKAYQYFKDLNGDDKLPDNVVMDLKNILKELKDRDIVFVS